MQIRCDSEIAGVTLVPTGTQYNTFGKGVVKLYTMVKIWDLSLTKGRDCRGQHTCYPVHRLK